MIDKELYNDFIDSIDNEDKTFFDYEVTEIEEGYLLSKPGKTILILDSKQLIDGVDFLEQHLLDIKKEELLQ